MPETRTRHLRKTFTCNEATEDFLKSFVPARHNEILNMAVQDLRQRIRGAMVRVATHRDLVRRCIVHYEPNTPITEIDAYVAKYAPKVVELDIDLLCRAWYWGDEQVLNWVGELHLPSTAPVMMREQKA